jgi:putative transposase
MLRLLQPLFALLTSASDRELARMVEYLKAENRVLRDKLPRRITVTPTERARLVKLGRALGKSLKDLITIVSPRTFARWVAGAGDTRATRTAPRKAGRPRTAEDVRELVIRIDRESSWGSLRVHGELRKLGVRNVSRSTVVNILREAHIDPGPKRGEGTWSEFIRRHAATLWAADFISVRTLTACGFVDLFLLFHIHIGTRRVIVSSPTANPNSEWVTQQARNASMQMDEWNLGVTHLIIDHDTKFTDSFDAVLEAEGAEIIRVGPAAPNLSPFAERWVRTLRSECLDHFVIYGERHLDYLVKNYLAHYLEERPHQGVGNVPLPDAACDEPPILQFPVGEAKCGSDSGGYSSTTTAPRLDLIPTNNSVTTRRHRSR